MQWSTFTEMAIIPSMAAGFCAMEKIKQRLRKNIKRYGSKLQKDLKITMSTYCSSPWMKNLTAVILNRIKSTIKILMTTTRYSLILFGKQEITIQSVGWLFPAGTQISTIPPETTVLNFLRINTVTNQSTKKNNELWFLFTITLHGTSVAGKTVWLLNGATKRMILPKQVQPVTKLTWKIS